MQKMDTVGGKCAIMTPVRGWCYCMTFFVDNVPCIDQITTKEEVVGIADKRASDVKLTMGKYLMCQIQAKIICSDCPWALLILIVKQTFMGNCCCIN